LVDRGSVADRELEAERLQLALDAGQMGTWSFDLRTGEQTWDHRQFALFGLGPETRPSRDLFLSMVLLEDRPRVELGPDSLRPGARHTSEFRIRRPDGSVCWLTAHSVTRADAAGVPIELVGVNWDVTERRLAETAARQTAEHLQLALAAGRMGTWRYDLRTGRQVWDARQYELLGLDPSREPTRDAFLSVVRPDDLAKVAFSEKDLKPGRFHDTEFRVQLADGTIRWLAARSFASHDADGKAIERIGVNWDITAQKQAELEREQAERRLELAVEAAQLGIWDWNVATGAFFYSARARELYGFSPDSEITYDVLKARTHPDDYPQIEPVVARALDPATGRQESYRYRITRADTGEERWLLAHGRAVFTDVAGQLRAANYTGTLQDITADVQIEQVLQDESARLQLALSAGELAVWELNLKTNEIVTSPALNRLYRLPEDSHPSIEEFQRLYAPGERERVEAEVTAALAAGETFVRFEAKHLWPDGMTKWIGVRAQFTMDETGAPKRVIGVAMDVTERRLAQERLEVTARELQHRVKNSLAVVQSIASQSFRSAPTKEAGLEAFSGRLRALAAATELLTRGDWQTVAIREIVSEIVRPYADEHDGRIQLEGPETYISSKHAVSLSMALHELSTNAVKYGALSTGGGQVDITWAKSGPGLTLIWTERGGPPVSARGPSGFGTRLLRSGLFNEPEGSVELAFEGAGVVCRIVIRSTFG
jgi:PAS domain S-box-containing protein